MVRFEKIAYLEANDKYVFVFTTDGQQIPYRSNAYTLEEKLPPQFYRIQKSFIINKEKIKEMHRHFNGRYLFVMDDKAGTQLTSGRTYHDGIKAEFGLIDPLFQQFPTVPSYLTAYVIIRPVSLSKNLL